MLTRTVNNVEFDIDIHKGNEIYFEEEFYEKCGSTGINDILIAVYNEKKKYTPESLFIELTGRCNFNCPFCYIHTCKEARNHSFISFERLKKDLDYLLEQGLITCTISGGECFLHPEFAKIYRYLKENGVLVTVLSNLSLLSEEILDLFCQLPPYKVDVTIYALSDHQMEKATGQNIVKAGDVLDNILRLKNAGIYVTCKTPWNTLTEKEIPEIETWCKEKEIPYFFSMEVFENYEGESMNDYSMPDDEVFADRVTAKLTKMSGNPEGRGRKMNFHCKGGEYGLFISYDYVLRPCMPFYTVKEANFKIGEEGIESALGKMKQFIEKYKNKPMTHCSGCEKHELCDLCIITQLSGKPESFVKNHCMKLNEFQIF